MKIGARVLKTGLAVTLSLLLSMFLIPGSSGVLAGIAASISTQPSVKKSFEIFVRRVLANILGGIIAVLMVYVLGTSPIAVGITVLISISILNAVRLGDVINLAVVTIIVIMLSSEQDYVIAAAMRVTDTFIGVCVSFIINWMIHPPKHDMRFAKIIENVTTEVLILMRAKLRKNTDFSILNRDLKWAKRQMVKFNSLFELNRKEWIFSKEKRYKMTRKLVIYRHMGRTTQCAIDLLTVLHKNTTVYDNFPNEMRTVFRERLETLMVAHEQILMKFYGKVPPEEVNFMEMDMIERDRYLDMFFEQAKLQEHRKEKHDFEGNSVIRILSESIRYEKELSDLNQIVRSYRLKSKEESQESPMQEQQEE